MDQPWYYTSQYIVIVQYCFLETLGTTHSTLYTKLILLIPRSCPLLTIPKSLPLLRTSLFQAVGITPATLIPKVQSGAVLPEMPLVPCNTLASVSVTPVLSESSSVIALLSPDLKGSNVTPVDDMVLADACI